MTMTRGLVLEVSLRTCSLLCTASFLVGSTVGPPTRGLCSFFLDELVNFQLQNKSSWLDELEQNEGIKEAATEQFPVVTCDALQDRFKVQFSEPEKVARFLCFYFRKYPTTLCRRSMKKQGSGMVGNSHGVDSFKAGGTIKMDKLS